MLKLLPEYYFLRYKNNPYFSQQLVLGKEVPRRCRNIKEISIARNRDYNCELTLYIRENKAGRSEAGIIYGPGPECDDCKGFPMEMLRLFSWGKIYCFDLIYQYYMDLVKEQIFNIVEHP